MSLSTNNHQSWANVAVFEDVNAAKAVEAFLTDRGIQVRTHNDRLFRAFLFLRPPRVTFRVQVPKDNLNGTHLLLNAGAPDALQKAIHCTSCGSLNVSYPQMTRKFILPTVLLHLGIIFRVVDHECYCETCHFIWYLPEKDIHTAPKVARQSA